MLSVRDSALAKHMSDGFSLENDAELKAYIYQHLVDLQPYLEPASQVAVLVNRDEDENGMPEHVLTLVATLGGYRLEAEGQNEDIYEAFNVAKCKMLRHLEEWHADSIDSNVRDSEIRAMVEGRHFVH